MTIDQAHGMADALVTALGTYGLVGLAFALAFVARGASRIDQAAQGMALPARLLLIPGATLLWPLMLAKWLRRHAVPAA